MMIGDCYLLDVVFLVEIIKTILVPLLAMRRGGHNGAGELLSSPIIVVSSSIVEKTSKSI